MSLTKTVLVVGGSGFVGSHITAKLREQYKVYSTYRSHPITMPGVTYVPMALEDRIWTKRLIRWVEPQVIVYCAGSNDRKWVEANKDEADLVHASGISTVAEACGILQSKVIYVSNSYTFEGKSGNYHEADTALPFTDFGKLKLSGENYLRAKSLNWAVVRSSPLYGRGVPYHPTFMDMLRMKFDRGQGVELSDRETHSYAPIEGLATIIEQMIESTIKNKILHYSGLTKVSAFEFAREFAKRYGYADTLVTRPQKDEAAHEDYSLNCSLAVEMLKLKPVLLSQGLDSLENT
jgi:dTDP-4-dehydrorhamnose reductase